MSEPAPKPADPASAANPADTPPPLPAEVKPGEETVKPSDDGKPDPKPVEGVKPDDKKPDDKQSTKPPGAPESYDLKVPEKSFMSADQLEAFKSYAKEKGLSNVDAQALLERDHGVLQAGLQAISQKAQQIRNQWITEIKADKDIGGEKYEQTLAMADRALQEFFPGADMKELLDNTGWGYNPGFVKGLMRIGKLMSPSSIHQPQGQPPPKRDPIKKLYDHATSQPQQKK
jgi:hypothetical protein